MTIARLMKTAGFRLAALAAGLFVLCMLAVALFIYLNVRQELETQLQEQVSAETRQLLGDYADDGLDELRHDISERLERNPGTRLRYTLKSPDGVSLFDRLALPETPGWSRVDNGDGPRLMLLTTPLDDGYTLGVAADTQSVSQTADALRHAFLIVVLPMIALAILSGAIVSRRFLSRVERLKQTADRIGKGALSARMEVSGSGDDFDGLVMTINTMLDRIEELVHDVRHVSTNIAHDLRTPLGRLRQRLEYLSENQASDGMRERADEAIGLLDDTLMTFSAMLKIAELETGVTEIQGQTLDARGLLDQLVEIYEPVVRDQGGDITIEQAGPAILAGDRPLLVQMLANLIENAMHHNPDGVRIGLSCGVKDGETFIRVSDNGRGIREADMQTVLKPFRRLDAARSTRGTGLGLTLAATIAARHGASLGLSDGAPGLVVTITFPAAGGDVA